MTTWTDNQKRAIEVVDQNLQIVACAGSGKTSTMVEHILQLLELPDVQPENIVAITYTEKAASSLKHKIFEGYQNKHKTLEGLANMYIGTIHGFCLNLLQENSEEYKTYETLNEIQTKLFIKKHRKENGIYDVTYYPKNNAPYKLLSPMSKSSTVSSAVGAYKTFLDIGREYGIEHLSKELQANIYKYEKTLKDECFFDFTSIIINTLTRLENGEFDDSIVKNLKYLIVDEYQDVNSAQEKIIRYFSEKGTIICVVGDDDQTIYQWRGSNLSYIKNFEINYPNVKKIDLDINFRSSIGITEISKQVINQNNNRILKDMKSNQSQIYEQGDIITHEFDTKEDEINFIIEKIKQLLGTEYKRKDKIFKLELDDMVILVSSVKKIPELISALEANNIDFIVEGTKDLFSSSEIILLCDTFKYLFQFVKLSLSNVPITLDYINNHLKFEQNFINKWKNYSKLNNCEIEEILKAFICEPFIGDEYEYTIQGALKKLFSKLDLLSFGQEKVLYNWGKFTEMINDFEKINLSLFPTYRLRAFETFLIEDAPGIYPEGWLSPNFKAIKCLRIMTYHQAKGLEYPVVFMPFLTKHAIFPQKNPGGTNAWGIFNNNIIKQQYEDDKESIRRVFYVGMTRSEKFLFLTRSNIIPKVSGKRVYKEPAFPFVEAKHSPYQEEKLYLDKVYKKSNLTKLSTDEIITLNFSLLKDLFDCPYKFQMLNIFGFRSPLNIRMGYGRSIHNMLDYIHKNHEYIDYMNDTVISEIVKKYLRLPYGSPKLYEAMTEKAFTNLKSYVRKNAARFKFIKFSEKGIEYNIDEYMFINGRIDLVRDELNHTITLVDFKSSSEVLSREQIKNQLMVYVLGYEKLTGEKVDYIESYDFNNSNPITIDLTSNDRKIFNDKLIDCETRIKNNSYPKAIQLKVNGDKEFCKNINCEFYESCFRK